MHGMQCNAMECSAMLLAYIFIFILFYLACWVENTLAPAVKLVFLNEYLGTR